MTDLRKAAQQALEALTCTGEDDDPGHRCGHCDDYVDRNGLVRAALRERLEQPKGLFIDMIAAHGPEFVEEVRRVGENIEQQAEPVAWVFAPNNELLWPSEVEVTNPIEIDSYQPLYSTPPQRKPLTDADIKLVMDGRGEEGDDDYIKPAFDPYGISEDDLIGFARAIEAAHDIKETP